MAAFDAQALAALRRGVEHFRARDYFAAHDDWEEVWQELSGHRRMFWQAMIQLVVGAYHFTNGNLRGCRGQWQKALQRCVDLTQRYEAPVPEPIARLHDILSEGLAIVERGENPLPYLEAFAASVVSETWFSLI
jgi:predicted metal-dependent hydrolase